MIKVLSVIGVILLVLIVLAVEIWAVVLVAGYIATTLGVSGALWWAIAIVVFLLINGVLGALTRIGK